MKSPKSTKNQKRNKTDLVDDLVWLYELSLAVGQSLDPAATCRSFLKTLMARRDLSGAEIWWVRRDAGADSAEKSKCQARLELLDAIPLSQVKQTVWPLTEPPWSLRQGLQARVFALGSAEFASLCRQATPTEVCCALYPLGDNGILLMRSASSNAFASRMLGQIRSIAAKLVTSIEGGMAYQQLHYSEATLRARTEELAESRRLLLSIIDTTPFRVFWKDRSLCYLGCNPAFARDAGLSRPEELIGKDDFAMAWGAQAELYRQDDSKVIESGQPHLAYEEPQTTPDGQTIWLRTSKVPLRNRDNEIIGLLGVYEDITADKQAEARRKLLEYALNHVEEAAYLVNRQGQFEYVNDGALRQLGYSREALLKMGVPDIDPDFPMAHWAAHWQELTEKGSLTLETTHRHKEGYPIPIEINANFIAFEEQDYNLALVRDITKRRAMQQQLEESKQAAERLARKKSEFLANMSHEIRTPLNAVLGFARMGVRENRGRKTGMTCERILKAGEHLLGVINDVLDFSRIEAGKFNLAPHPMRLEAVIRLAADLLADLAAGKGLAYEVELAPDLPEWVEGDAQRIQQILVNLISNAIKFTEQGEVRIRVAKEAGWFYFKVIDTGIGMNEATLARLFLPFEQADNSSTRRFGGSGLGLAISRSLAQAMGGEISVDTALKYGSSFTLALPLPETQAEPALQIDPAEQYGLRLDRLRLLAVEDMEANRIILEDLLIHEGAQVVFAENGLLALAKIEERGAAMFDAVLMDVQMPEMDGYEATQHLRERAPNLPVIGLTAHAMPEERARCLEVGMVDCLNKPFDPEAIIASIRRHVASKGNPARQNLQTLSTAAATPEAEGKPVSDIDWPRLFNRYQGRRAFIAKLCDSILQSESNRPAGLRTAAENRNMDGLRFLAHSIKGLAGMLEAAPLLLLAQEVEQAAGAGREEAAGLGLRLADRLEATLTDLQAFINPPQEPDRGRLDALLACADTFDQIANRYSDPEPGEPDAKP